MWDLETIKRINEMSPEEKKDWDAKVHEPPSVFIGEQCRYHVNVSGCDDSTYITIDVPPECVSFLKELAKQITEASRDCCQPTMSVWEEQ